MKRFKRFVQISLVVLVLYLGSYALLVHREPRRSYPTQGAWPMEARYIPKGSPLPFRETLEEIAETIYTPLEWLDRRARPEQWETPPPPRTVPVPLEMTAM